MKYSYIFEKCSTFVVSKEILFVFAAASPSPSEGTGASRREQRLYTELAKAFRAEKQGMILSGMYNLIKQCKVMAVNTIAFPVAARQNKNDDSTANGKWFLVPYWPETLTLRGLIERVAFDQSVYSRDIVEGVLQKLTTVMVELLKSGQPVKWDGLGTFTPNINSKGVVELNSVSVDQIEGVRINFIPENAKGEELTSKKFKDLCVFEVLVYLETTNIGTKQKPKYQRVLYPLDYEAPVPGNNGGSSSGGSNGGTSGGTTGGDNGSNTGGGTNVGDNGGGDNGGGGSNGGGNDVN